MRPLLLVALLGLAGCMNAMSAYYGSISSAAIVTKAGFEALDKYDTDVQAKIREQAKTDPVAAQAVLDAYIPKYKRARKALDISVVAVQSASAAAPVIEAAKDRKRQVADWIERLYTLGTEIAASLGEIGVKLPVTIGGR